MSDLASQSLRGLSATFRFAKDGTSFFRMLCNLVKEHKFKEPGELPNEEFFRRNKGVRIDDIVKNSLDEEHLNTFKKCLDYSNVQYTMQSMGDDTYTIYFRADDASKVKFALNSFTKIMDEMEIRKAYYQQKDISDVLDEFNANVNNMPNYFLEEHKYKDGERGFTMKGSSKKEKNSDNKEVVKDATAEEEEEMGIDAIISAAEKEAEAHNADIENNLEKGLQKSRDVVSI
ncbi:MAG: DUF3801 domain-containing protein [Clostridia bacterium]|nr:DUF3801 domain-containing protein [Clostridia bacterium]